MHAMITGFSKLTREEKITSLIGDSNLPEDTRALLDQFTIDQSDTQKIMASLSENTLTNFPLPYGIVPNFIVNNKVYHLPFVTEESSVVAATAKAAKIWSERGGFHATVKSSIKTGQVHFIWKGEPSKLKQIFPLLKAYLLGRITPFTVNMQKRGGGIDDIQLIDKCQDIPHYYQLLIHFNTMDAMGANFINSSLEVIAGFMIEYMQENSSFSEQEKSIEIIMSILSNYNPECIVEAYVECEIDQMQGFYGGFSIQDYVRRFKIALDIADFDIYRAVTHNKGIGNGIDAIALATGNDVRAIEAGMHAYASKDGHYKSLSSVQISGDVFRFSIKLPLTVGTVGGITGIHPLAQFSLKLLENPNADELMMIIASAGLASNFAAINALTTSGIQKGHMKMHLSNILYELKANEEQMMEAFSYFKDKMVSVSEVRKFIERG
jgi:hydroxymethylglutaryl-CoA reductase